MDVNSLSLAIMVNFLTLTGMQFVTGEKKRLVVFSKPNFSSVMGAHVGRTTLNIIEEDEKVIDDSEETDQRTTNQEAKESPFQFTGTSKVGVTTTDEQAAGTTAGVTTDEVCNGWNSGDTSCYMFVQTIENWEEAKEDCSAYNVDAHLAFIESDDENSFILDLIKRELISTGDDFHVWIGLKQIPFTSSLSSSSEEIGEGNWTWYGTQAENPEEGPRSIIVDVPDRDPNCVRIDKNFRWNDKECSFNAFYICELEKD